MKISVGPIMSLETTFQKNSFHPGEKKDFGRFFSNSRLFQTFSNVFLGSTSFLSNYNASSKIISSTTKRLLKSQTFEKKAIVPIEKKLQAISSRLANKKNPKKQKYKVLEILSSIFVQVFRFVSLEHKRSTESSSRRNGFCSN